MAESGGVHVLLGSRCVVCPPRAVSSLVSLPCDVTRESNEMRRRGDIDYDGSYSAECVEKVHCFVQIVHV